MNIRSIKSKFQRLGGWWLSSPGSDKWFSIIIRPDGSIYENGTTVDQQDVMVRPALKYTNFKSQMIISKDKDCFIFNETKWKVIDYEKELTISVLPIGFDKFDEEVNNYQTSYNR